MVLFLFLAELFHVVFGILFFGKRRRVTVFLAELFVSGEYNTAVFGTAERKSTIKFTLVIFPLRWPDVLVEREEVGGIIRVFERDQPFVVGPIGCPHPLFSLVAQEVDIDATACKWRERLAACTSPRDVLLCFAAIPSG